MIRLYDVKPEGIVVNDNYKKKKCCFEVQTSDRVFYLCADTELERDIWVQTIKAGKVFLVCKL